MTDEQRENAALYALELLESEERDAFESALDKDADLAALVQEHRAVLSILSLSPETREPPESLREVILERAREIEAAGLRAVPPSRSQATSTKPAAASGKPFSRVLPWALAACFAIGFGFLFVQVNGLKQKNAELAQLANPENFRFAVLAAQTETLPEISASVAWNAASSVGIIGTASLPAQPPDKTYQLWIFEEGNPSPVSAGIFDPGRDPRIVFRPERPVTDATTFAVSIEVSGGRPQPEGPVVLAGSLQQG